MSTNLPRHTMPVGLAAKIIGCTPGYLHQLDAELEPARDGHGRRWYDPDVIGRFVKARSARKDKR